MSRQWQLIVVMALWLPGLAAADSLQQGRAAFERGALEAAITNWQQAVRLAVTPKATVDALVSLGVGYQALGQHRLAVATLQEAVAVAERAHDRNGLLLAKSNLGVASSCGQELESAERNLREGLALAESVSDDNSAALIWNNLGTALAAQGKTDEALTAFRQSVTLAGRVTNRLQRAKAAGNGAATAAQAQRASDAEPLMEQALSDIASLPPAHEPALLLIRSAQTDTMLKQWARAAQSAQRAITIAEQLGDQRALTHALGALGRIHEQQGAIAPALALTRRAAFVAQQISSPDALYRWEWQLGRLLAAHGDRDGAMAAYRRAVQTLQSIRHDLAAGYAGARGSFRETVGPVYFELADLLLQKAAVLATEETIQLMLREARDTVEQLKASELEDYLQDECVNLLRMQAARLEQVDRKTAVIYIIPLADRTELLVGLADGLQRFSVPVGAEQLTAEVRQFRLNLEKRTTNQYRRQARQLYQWLIGPLQATLAEKGVATLVFVPDGALRSVPLGALQDGEHFLIEQFAVAVTPGLTLLAPRPMPRTGIQVLCAGISETVQGFPELPNVAVELRQVQALFRGPLLLNQEFVLPVLQRDFQQTQFQVVHFATHGQFGRNTSQSFLLTHDGKLTLDQLETLLRPSQARGKPVELLALSACQTAAGDERAALGLAGVAVKAGARSALATLWFVQDESTAMLVTDFYSVLLRDATVSKAKALQQAQIKLLHDARYGHPGYWAPYLLIGNWL